MHSSDEQLIAFLDGELSVYQQMQVRRHLESCWPCRARLTAAEQEIHKLTKEFEEWSFPGSIRMAEGKLRLQDGIRAFETHEGAKQKPVASLWNSRPWLWSTAAGVSIALAILLGWPKQQSQEVPVAAETIIRATAVESALYQQPVRQTFAVEIAELRPMRKSRSSRLEVWADRPNGRFASKWVVGDGSLQHAVWRTGQGADFLYSPALSSIPISRHLQQTESLPLSSLAEYGLDVEHIEKAFLRWMETGAGQAVSFTSELTTWSRQNGVAIRAELIRVDGASPAMRVTAERKTQRMTAVLSADFDVDNYRPRLQTIRFETAERAVEFRLTATQIRRVSSGELSSSVFSPEASLFSTGNISGALPPKHLEIPTELSAGESVASSDTESGMIEAHYSLHQAGACLGEPVKIEQQGDVIRIEDRSHGNLRRSFTSTVPLRTILSAFAELRDAPPPTYDLPDGMDSGFRSATVLRHAWALSRLARHFPVGRTDKLLREDWRLLELMVRDHVAVIDGELERIHLQQDEDRPAMPQRLGWRYSSSVLFEALLNAHELLRDEPIAKVAPVLAEVDAQLQAILADVSSEYSRSQRTAH